MFSTRNHHRVLSFAARCHPERAKDPSPGADSSLRSG